MNMPRLTLRRARLPNWLGAASCPASGLSDIAIEGGRIAAITPARAGTPPLPEAGLAFCCTATNRPSPPGCDYDAQGALTLPGLVDIHTHLDKTFTRHRTGNQLPGLLGAIDAMMRDRASWDEEDVRTRASQGLQWAWEAGVTRLRSHCDWWEADQAPLAWQVLLDLAAEWRERIRIDCVNLAPLSLYADASLADRLARQVAKHHGQACLGGFIHSSNWDASALRNLVTSAQRHGLALDLHIDEELNPAAQGLQTLAHLLKHTGMEQRVVCGHACALAAQDETQALQALDAVAETSIALTCLPSTNLLLQDARTGHTPRLRGLTLVHEARARGIPVFFASDNVEDPFCASGSFDPLDALASGSLAAQLEDAFDRWSDSVCRADWIDGGAAPLAPGAPANLILLPAASAHGFPSRIHPRAVMRNGMFISPVVPPLSPPGAAS